MGTFTEDDIRAIIKRASILQKIHDQSPDFISQASGDDDQVYEIADSLEIPRRFVREALTEFKGGPIPHDEPVFLVTDNASHKKLQAFASGNIDGYLLNELKGLLEYHFNSGGSFSRKRGAVIWKAKPSGISRYFTLSKSPQLEIREENNHLRFTLEQNTKTYNKLMIPGIFSFIGFILTLTAVIFDEVGNDQGPTLIFSTMMLSFSIMSYRFLLRKRKKVEKGLLDLIETIQQVAERQFLHKTGKRDSGKAPEIIITEEELSDMDDVELGRRNSITNS